MIPSDRVRILVATTPVDWPGLQTFLHDGRVEIDSNGVENLIRPIALNRKDALFAGHDEGCKAWGRIASLIETCKINGVVPFAYLKATLETVANGQPQSASTTCFLGNSNRQAEKAWPSDTACEGSFSDKRA